jgi:alkyldihydroxyacetonephosphate synthase
MGHEPDSLEFSTLGGWIATKASGMKRNKYGNIEDIVLSVSIAGADGELRRKHYGRESCGIDLKDLLLGSEGCLGIITRAQVKVFPLPAVKQYECVMLQDFSCGVRVANLLVRQNVLLPASIRLLDNDHFRLGQALRPSDGVSLSLLFHNLTKSLEFYRNGFEHEKVCVICFVYEGTKDEVLAQKTSLFSVLKHFTHQRLGNAIGKSCYDMTFAIAYLRDFALTYCYLGESLETFVPWSRVEDLVQRVRQRLVDEHAALLLPGRPFMGCRITQLYHEGVCVYVYVCVSLRGVDEPELKFARLEQAARSEILACGGSISHHHGVGKIRIPFLSQVDDQSSLALSRKLKMAMDPTNVFGARNGRFADT